MLAENIYQDSQSRFQYVKFHCGTGSSARVEREERKETKEVSGRQTHYQKGDFFPSWLFMVKPSWASWILRAELLRQRWLLFDKPGIELG